jgi:hypothetical protein
MVIDGSNGLKFPDNTNQQTAIGYNRIINGAMTINQRATSITSSGYTVDRFGYFASQASKATVAQSSVAPAGFINSLLVTSSSAYTVLAGDIFELYQVIEGLNISDLGWGTANAQPVTLSFWVRSSLTGTFGGALNNNGLSKSYPFNYTISAANTWEQKTITIAGDTSGTWITTNGTGIQVNWGLGVGSTYSGTAGAWASATYASATGATSVVGTNGATFYITGVQLEKGSTATSFDYRPYGQELQLCQRYYWRFNIPVNTSAAVGFSANASTGQFSIAYPVPMRIAPTALEQSGTATHYGIQQAASQPSLNTVPVFVVANNTCCLMNWTTAGALTTGQAVVAWSKSDSAYLGWSAEL